MYPNNALTLNNTAINVANYRQSIISGSFVQPGQTKSLLIPRLTLPVTAASSVCTTLEVTFSWNTSGINEQNISVKALITDSEYNQKALIMSDVKLTSSHVSVYGYQSRGSVEAAVEPVEQQPEAAATDTVPAHPIIKHKEVTQILHYRHRITSLFRPL